MADVLVAAWLGGAACYAGVLLTPTRTRLPLGGIVLLVIVWPVSIAFAHAAEIEQGGPR